MTNNFECRCSSVAGTCLKNGIQRQEDCTEKCVDYNKCEECSWKDSDYCKDCTNNTIAEGRKTTQIEDGESND